MLVRNTFADFKSRCRTFLLWSAFTPNNNWMNQFTTTFSSKSSPFFFQFFRKVCKSPSAIKPIITLTILHQDDKCILKMEAFLVLNDERDSHFVEFLQNLNLFYLSNSLLIPMRLAYLFRPSLRASSSWRHKSRHLFGFLLKRRYLKIWVMKVPYAPLPSKWCS